MLLAMVWYGSRVVPYHGMVVPVWWYGTTSMVVGLSVMMDSCCFTGAANINNLTYILQHISLSHGKFNLATDAMPRKNYCSYNYSVCLFACPLYC